MEVWLMEYDRTKAREKCPGCQRFYKLLDDVKVDDDKNIVQITAHKARVTIKKEIMDEYLTKEAIAVDDRITKTNL